MHGQMIYHTAIPKIPGPAIAPSSVNQQHGNFAGVGADFLMNVNGDTVDGREVKIGALNDRLLCAGRQDAHQNHCRAKNLKERIGNLYTAILSLTKLCTFEHDWSLANVHSVRVAVGPQKPPRLKALRCVGVSGGVTSWLARFWQAPASTPRWFPVQLGYRRTAPGGGKRSNQLRSES